MSKAFGLLIVFLSTVGYALLIPLLKKAGKDIAPFTMMAVSMAVLFLASVVLSIFFEGSLSLKFLSNKSSLGLLILVGVINTVAFWLAILGYKYMAVWQQSLFALLTPVLAGIFAYLILGEALSPKLIFGLFIMGAGLLVATL